MGGRGQNEKWLEVSKQVSLGSVGQDPANSCSLDVKINVFKRDVIIRISVVSAGNWTQL